MYDSLLIPPGMRSPCGRVRIVRICAVSEDGLLTSPHRGTVWTGPVMRAESWSDSDAVLGQCGLHGVWDRWRDIMPADVGDAVVRVLGDGRAVVSPSACRVERMAMQEIVLHPDEGGDMVAAVRRRYPEVPVRRARASRARRRRRLVSLDFRGHVVVRHYRHGILHGRWEEAWPDGSRIVRHYRHGVPHGRWEDALRDGRRIVRHYRNGRLHGRWEEAWPGGRRIIQRYRDGARHGRWDDAWPDGLRTVRHYRNGRLHGRWERALRDGRRIVRHYRNGRLHGLCEEAWPDGRRIVRHYRNGRLHGRWEEVHPDGRRVVQRYAGHTPPQTG